MHWFRANSISKSPSQVCIDIVQIFLYKASSLPQPCLLDKVYRLSSVVPANSLRDRAGEPMLWHQRVSFVYLTGQEKAEWPPMSRLSLQVVKDKARRHHRRGSETSNIPSLLLQTSRRDWCPDLYAHHSALNFLPFGQSQTVSPVFLWPDSRDCFLEQFSGTSHVFCLPLPCHGQVLPPSMKIHSLLTLWEGRKVGIWSLLIICSSQDSTGSLSWRHCTKLWYLPKMNGCRDGIGLLCTSYHPRGSFWSM